MANSDEVAIMAPVLAVADLCGRSGARHFECGYLNDELTIAYALRGAEWWASAQYRGARIMCEKQPDPALACDGLAHMILDGAECQHCHRRCSTAQSTPLATFVHARRPPDPAAICEWRREGDVWRRGCEG